MTRIGKRLAGALLLSLLLSLALAQAAMAGGWSTTTLDGGGPLEPVGSEGGTAITPGEPFSFGFIVRQHGKTPMTGLSPTILFVNTTTKDQVMVTAREEGEPGHYVASATLPAGEWSWSIFAFGEPARMAPFKVLNAAPAQVPVAPASASPLPFLALGALAIALALGVFVALRGRRRVQVPA